MKAVIYARYSSDSQREESHTGKVHRYYACVRQKKHKCDKKMLHKEKLENFIVYKTMEMLKEDSYVITATL